MKFYLTFLMALLITAGFNAYSSVSYADDVSDSDTKIASAQDQRGSIGKRYASDVTRDDEDDKDEKKSDEERTIDRAEIRQRLLEMSPEKRADFLAERLIRRNPERIRQFIENNPELKKRIEQIPPEKRREAIRKAIRNRIQQRMRMERPEFERMPPPPFFDPQERRGMMFDRDRPFRREMQRHPQQRFQQRYGMREQMQMMQRMMRNPEMLRRMIENMPLQTKVRLYRFLKQDIERSKKELEKKKELLKKKDDQKRLEKEKPIRKDKE